MVTTEESSDSDATASHLIANLNLQVAAKRNLSLPALSSSLFTDPEEKGYTSTSATSAPPATAGSSSSRKHGHEMGADKISNEIMTASQTLYQQIQVAREEKQAEKCARHDLNLWHLKEKVHQRDNRQEHELLLQRERYEHEKEMKDKDLATLELQIQLEKIKKDRVAMEKGIAGGEIQDST